MKNPTDSDEFQASLDQQIAQLIVGGHAGRAEIFRAVRDKKLLSVWTLRPTDPLPDWLWVAKPPAMVLLPDDHDHPVGPSGWKSLPAVLSWAHAAMVHAAGADVQTYRLAVDIAVENGRVVLVESCAKLGPVWAMAMLERNVPTALLLPEMFQGEAP